MNLEENVSIKSLKMIAVAAVSVFSLSACAVDFNLDSLFDIPLSVDPNSKVDVAKARDTLDTIRIRTGEDSPASGYSGRREELFGPAWTDSVTGVELAGNGCDTRNDILVRDLTDVTKGSDDCTVQSGVLDDPYSGETINFKRGRGTSMEVQIDHIVALGNAWVSGAESIGQEQRVALANDPDNLIAVKGSENGSKGARDAAQWLPSDSKSHCEYASSQTMVKAKYRLSMTMDEADTIRGILDRCSASASTSPTN